MRSCTSQYSWCKKVNDVVDAASTDICRSDQTGWPGSFAKSMSRYRKVRQCCRDRRATFWRNDLRSHRSPTVPRTAVVRWLDQWCNDASLMVPHLVVSSTPPPSEPRRVCTCIRNRLVGTDRRCNRYRRATNSAVTVWGNSPHPLERPSRLLVRA